MAEAKIYIQLNRTLHGWGDKDEVLEVEENEDVAALLENELATKVMKKDLTATIETGATSDAENPADTPAEGEPLTAQPDAVKVGRAASPVAREAMDEARAAEAEDDKPKATRAKASK